MLKSLKQLKFKDQNNGQLLSDRMEAFSDAVMAIIITITIVEFRIPSGSSFSSLKPLIPVLITYLVSFQTIGTYWNNHHHLLHTTKRISASSMWLNLNLLFWISLIPFATNWLGQNNGSTAPTVIYAAILLMCALSYTALQYDIVSHSDKKEELFKELIKSKKSLVSLTSYALAVIVAFINPFLSYILIIFVSLIWFIPDKRVEKFIS